MTVRNSQTGTRMWVCVYTCVCMCVFVLVPSFLWLKETGHLKSCPDVSTHSSTSVIILHTMAFICGATSWPSFAIHSILICSFSISPDTAHLSDFTFNPYLPQQTALKRSACRELHIHDPHVTQTATINMPLDLCINNTMNKQAPLQRLFALEVGWHLFWLSFLLCVFALCGLNEHQYFLVSRVAVGVILSNRPTDVVY